MTPSLTFQQVETTLFYTYFLVTGDGEPYEIVLHRDTLGYGRKWFRGTDEEWQRDVASGYGCLRRRKGSDIMLIVVETFNAWRLLEYELARIAHSYPQRPLRNTIPPEPAWGARYDRVNGWTEIQPLPHDIQLECVHAHTSRIRRRF